MTSSKSTNAALLQSLQRARERQRRVSAAPSSRASARSRVYTPNNTKTIETITTDPNGEQRIERRVVNNNDQPSPKPLWNSGSVAHPSKTPRSVFLDDRSVDNVTPRQIITATSSNRSIPYSDVSTPAKVVRVSSTATEEPSSSMPVYIQQPKYTYPTNPKLIRTGPEVIVVESQPAKRSIFNFFRRKNNYQTGYYDDREILLNQPESSVYRFCQCCARGRVASRCPSCYFCELFYGCPIYCWLLTFFLLLLPMLILFGWFLSEQPALNPAKRQYVTQQSSIVQNDVYAVMHNCAVPSCTNTAPAVTINALYLTYHDYSATQISSNANISPTFSFIFFIFLNLLVYFNQPI